MFAFQLISSLTVYAFPTSITRVFAFDYAGSLARRKSRVLSGALQNEGTPESSDVSTFRSAEDWQKVLATLLAILINKKRFISGVGSSECWRQVEDIFGK